MKPINAADVLRFVHREAGFLKHFEHIGVPGISPLWIVIPSAASLPATNKLDSAL